MPRGRAAATDQTTLRMALVGYELEKEKIDQKIREIRARLGKSAGGETRASSKQAPGRRGRRARRVLSAAARRRISAAQKRRWAAHRKAQAGKGQAA